MEISGPSSLWKDYDVLALPLNVSELSRKQRDGIAVRELYFDGFATADGRVRAFLRILENPQAKNAILYLPDNKGYPDNVPYEMYSYGYTVAILDYIGESDESRFTFYPKSLESCNCYKKRVFEAPEDAIFNCWYVWACLARKGIELIKSSYSPENIYALGKGLGGCTAYKLAAFDDGLTAIATLLNVLPTVEGTGNEIINYRAALDNNAYSAITRHPLFMAVASNDEDGSLDDMSKLAASTAQLDSIRIVERAFSGGIHVAIKQIHTFFTCSACGAHNPPKLEITAKNSGGKLYFNIKAQECENCVGKSELQLYAAFCITNPSHRNWTNIPVISLGPHEYIATVDVLQPAAPVYAFVNIKNSENCIVSSPVLEILPKTLGIQPVVKAWKRLIYDGSMGNDVWASPGGGEIKTISGPFEIEGVTSTANTLTTFKLGDMLFRAENGDALLQISVSGKAEKIHVKISDETDGYTCDLELTNKDEWNKFTLSLSDFKGSGALNTWSKIILLEFTAEDSFIIGSVLWV